MKLVNFIIGMAVGVFGTAGLILASEVFRDYRKNLDSDPWQEYHSEDDTERTKIEVQWFAHEQLVTEKMKDFQVMTPDEFRADKERDERIIEHMARMEYKSADEPDTDSDDESL